MNRMSSSKRRDSSSASGWLGDAKKRRRNKDIRNYGEVTVQTSRNGGATRPISSFEGWEKDSDFVQPSLKEFLQSKPRKRNESVPSKSSPFSVGTIPASIFSSGVRKKVSPSNSTTSTWVATPKVKDSNSVSPQRERSGRCLVKNVRANENEGQPPAKKRKSEKENDTSVHLKTSPSKAATSCASTKNVEAQHRVLPVGVCAQDRVQPVAALENHRGMIDQSGENRNHCRGEGRANQNGRDTWFECDEQDKENHDPNAVGKTDLADKKSTRKDKSSKRHPLSELTAEKCHPGEEAKEFRSSTSTRTNPKCARPRIGSKTGEKKRLVPVREESDSQELYKVSECLPLEEELYMDTNELLAELSYCEKMSV